MRILVTGADRPVGAAVVRELERHDVELLVTDATDSDGLRQAVNASSHVVHAHALSEPGRPASDYTDANVHTLTELLDHCRRAELEQVLLISTTETYGSDLPPWPVTESWAPRALGPMLQSRMAAERVARTYRRRVPLSILRAAPLVLDGDSTIMRVVRHHLSRPRAALVAGGQTPISVLAAADLGRAVWAMLSQPEEVVGKVFHFTSAHATWQELAVEACHLRGIREQFWTAPYLMARGLEALKLSAWVLPEPDDVEGYVALTGRPHLIDDSKARVELGYAPLLGVRGALAQALDVYRRSSDG